MRGRVQQASCLKVLRTLDVEGRMDWPAGPGTSPTPRELDTPVPEAQEIPDAVGDLEDLEIGRVTPKPDRAIWTTLM